MTTNLNQLKKRTRLTTIKPVKNLLINNIDKNKVKQDFVIFVRTKQFFQLRFKSNIDEKTPVYISIEEVKEFYESRGLESKEFTRELIKENEIKVYKVDDNSYKFTALKPGVINPNLIKFRGQKLNKTSEIMMNYLRRISLKPQIESTLYFDTFLNYRDYFLRQFFTIDDFSGRIHTPVSNLKKAIRKNLLIDNEETTAIDVVTMQPLILGKVLFESIGNNEFSQWINSGQDIYLLIKDRLKLQTREEAKEYFFEILFSRPNNKLLEMFGNSTWITWINDIKKKTLKKNPHTYIKPHSNLSWILSTIEVKMMNKVWEELIKHDIVFLSVHDEIIVKYKDSYKANEIFKEVMKANFEFFKLSGNISPPPEKTPLPEKLKKLVDKLGLIYEAEEMEKFLNPPPPPDEKLLIEIAISSIGLNNRKHEEEIPYFDMMISSGIIKEATPLRNQYYLSNSTPF